MAWDEASVELLERLVESGLTARDVAVEMTAELSQTFTVGQVMGKLKRMGLKLADHKPGKKPSAPATPATPQAAPQSPRTSVPAPPAAPAAPLRLPWDKVPANGCWFEVSGDQVRPADMKFCGRPRAPGRPYCQGHVDMTSHAPQPRGVSKWQRRVA